jgi:microcystin-dependent protein
VSFVPGLLNDQLLLINQNQALFSLLSTPFVGRDGDPEQLDHGLWQCRHSSPEQRRQRHGERVRLR